MIFDYNLYIFWTCEIERNSQSFSFFAKKFFEWFLEYFLESFAEILGHFYDMNWIGLEKLYSIDNDIQGFFRHFIDMSIVIDMSSKYLGSEIDAKLALFFAATNHGESCR